MYAVKMQAKAIQNLNRFDHEMTLCWKLKDVVEKLFHILKNEETGTQVYVKVSHMTNMELKILCENISRYYMRNISDYLQKLCN